MRNLLQSKLAVGLLATAAVALATWNIIVPMLPRTAHAQPAPAAPPKASADPVPPLPYLPAHLDEIKAWASSHPEIPRLDPFAFAEITAQAPRIAGITNLTLHAISIDGPRAFAVVNRRVVAEGDRVGDCTIEKIEPTTVWVQNPRGRLPLRLLQGGPAQQFVTSENRRPADLAPGGGSPPTVR